MPIQPVVHSRGVTSPERDPQRHAPLVFLAPARSHSSVVATMVGCHPDLYGFPELILFDQATIGDRLDARPRLGKQPPGWNPVAGLERAVAQLHDGAQGQAEVAAARRWLEERRSWRGADVLDHLLELVSPLVGVEKSPNTVNGEDKMARVIEAYPRARLVHLVRHPVSAERSVQMHLFLFDHPEPCARGWHNQHRRILRFCDELPAEQCLRVRSEDVLNDPDRELRRIATWLGVRDDADAIDAMRHPDRSPYVGIGPEGSTGGNDPSFLRNPLPRPVVLPTTLEHPPEWKLPPELLAEIEALAISLGYGERMDAPTAVASPSTP